jgi:hypothetical protein
MSLNASELVGKIFVSHEVCQYKESIKFFDEYGNYYLFYHDVQCCEHVYIEDICGDLDDLMDSEILQSEMVSSEMTDEDIEKQGHKNDFGEWYFYKLATIKGSVTLRWCGISTNYSTEVKIEYIIES